MLYRYLAVDEAGSFPLLSYQHLEPLVGDGVRLILLEATDDWPAALRAHQLLESQLREATPRRAPRAPSPGRGGRRRRRHLSAAGAPGT